MYRELLLFIIAAVISISTTGQNASALFSAVEKNDIETVRKLLEEGASPNATDEFGDAILMQAVLYASADCMKLLLDKGADVNFKNKQGHNALLFCVHEPDKIKLLVSRGADINVSGKSGNTPLLIAAVGTNNFESVKLLLDNGANPLVKNKIKESALTRATPLAGNDVIDLLLLTGNEIDSVSENFTPLSAAIAFSNRNAVLHLLEKGANPNIRDFYGLPVGLAVVFPDTLVSNLLIQKTTNINDLDVDGLTAMAWALYNEHDQPGIIQSLIDHGANVNMIYKNGTTALSWGLQKGNTKSVEILKKAGAKK